MSAFAGKTQFAQGGGNDYSLLNRMYVYPSRVGNVRMAYSGAIGSANGISPADAYATLIAAQTAAVADNDDLVLVLPGHAESVVAAAGMTFSKAGVAYQGIGSGRGRPTITFSTSTAAQIVISGARITFRNIVFDFTGVDAIVAAISVTGADCTFEDCEFLTNSATIGCVLGILTAATADRFAIRRCRFIGAQTNSGTTTTAQVKHEVGADLCIEDCWFTGKMTQAILNATTILRAKVSRNIIHTYTGTLGFSFETSSTGFATDNRICVASGTTPVAGAALSYSANHYTTEGNGPTGGTADAI